MHLIGRNEENYKQMLEGICGVLSVKFPPIDIKNYLFKLYNAIEQDITKPFSMVPSNTAEYAIYAFTTQL